MNYLLDKRRRNTRSKTVFMVVGIVVVLLLLTPFVIRKIAPTSHFFLAKLFSKKDNLQTGIESVFVSKTTLLKENASLKQKNLELITKDDTLAHIQTEMDTIKAELGRAQSSGNLVIASVLSTPRQSPYDTLVIDAGTASGISQNMRVFAHAVIPVGYVSEVHQYTSIVTLYSSPGIKTQANFEGSDLRTELVGRGGGNFEAEVPIDVPIADGQVALVPGFNTEILAVVGSSTRDPRDPFQKVLLVSPANVQNLSYIYIEKEGRKEVKEKEVTPIVEVEKAN